MVSARSPISNSSSHFTEILGIVPSTPITIGITVYHYHIAAADAILGVFSQCLVILIGIKSLHYPRAGNGVDKEVQ